MDVIAKIRNSGKRCQIYVTCEGAFRVRNELGGKCFLLQSHVTCRSGSFH
jgi:hypothetical protein